MVNPNSLHQMTRLMNAVNGSYQRLQGARQEYVNVIKQFVGPHYARQGDDKEPVQNKRPINLLNLAVTIYARRLAARAPRVLETPSDPALKADLVNHAMALNILLKEQHFERLLQRDVQAAMFGWSVVNVSLQSGMPIVIDGETIVAGVPQMELVAPADWVHDMAAKDWAATAYQGHRFSMRLEEAKESDLFDPNRRAELAPGQQREPLGETRASELSRGNQTLAREEDYLDFWQLYLPIEKLLVYTQSLHDQTPLGVRPYQGSQRGLYFMLGFQDVPEQVLPLPPVQMWQDIDDLVNILFNKASRRAKNAKEVHMFRQERDAKMVAESRDSEYKHVDDPNNVKTLKISGLPLDIVAYVAQLERVFNKLTHNLDAQGGLAPQAETLGQEQIIQSATSVIMEQMADRVIEHAKELILTFGEYTWDDKLREVPLVKRADAGIDIASSWGPEDRQGPFPAEHMELDIYSMRNMGPQERIAMIFQTLDRVLPLMQIAPQIVKPLVEYIGRYSNLPELAEIFQALGVSVETPNAAEKDVAMKPPNTTRTYQQVRKSARPGGGGMGAEELMQMAQSRAESA